MWTSLACVAVCLALPLAGAAPKAASLPKEFKTCERGDDVCLKDAIAGAISFLVKGYPKLGVLPLDPLRVTEMVLDQGSGPVSLKLSLKNQDIRGVAQIALSNISTELSDDKFRLRGQGVIPVLALTGDYKIGGQILVLPIQGEGKNNITLFDLDVKVDITAQVTKGADGEDYGQLDNCLFTFENSHMRIYLSNLFNGNRALADNMNAFLNENWKIVLEELKPVIQEAAGQVFLGLARAIYSKVPYSVIHPKA